MNSAANSLQFHISQRHNEITCVRGDVAKKQTTPFRDILKVRMKLN
jgi:hypothetical protein